MAKVHKLHRKPILNRLLAKFRPYMILFKTSLDLGNHLALPVQKAKKIGFVPTMGALHLGHLGLIKESKKTSDLTICSIFVNPTQFNDPADFANYPQTLEQDIYALESIGTDIVFLPNSEEIYPNGLKLTKKIDLEYLETILEGKYRPGHFQGVCQVVERLLMMVKPTSLFLGQKDFQQYLVIKKLIRSMGWPINIRLIHTYREPNGLALSSRNLRLSQKDKIAAATLNQSLEWMKNEIHPGNLDRILENATKMIKSAGFDKIDYVAICNAQTLVNITYWDGETPIIGLVAAYISGIRLIDNRILN